MSVSVALLFGMIMITPPAIASASQAGSRYFFLQIEIKT